MIYPIEGQKLPELKYTRDRVNFRCDCGNQFNTMWSCFTSGKTKSCGSCKLFEWKKSNKIKYEYLTLLDPLDSIERMTDKPLWLCSCGTKKNIILIGVATGQTLSCGCQRNLAIKNARKTQKVYPVQPASIWLQKIPSIVNKNLPDAWSEKSSKKFWFQCVCGREYEHKFNRHSEKSNCKKCTERNLIHGEKINDFIYDGEDIIINTNTNKELYFICKCGNRALAPIRDVFSGYKQTCGKCNQITKEEIALLKFGKLQIKNPKNIYRFSDQKTTWICDCGNEVKTTTSNVTKGVTRSCGRCNDKINKWYVDNLKNIKSLQCPIGPGLLLGGFQVLETIKNVSTPFKAACPICGSIHYPRLNGIKNGGSLTCGCASNRVSLGQQEVASAISDTGLEAVLEYEVNGFKYDIFVPGSNLLIEYHGLRWHSTLESRKRDQAKYKLAMNNNYKFMVIFEDEWQKSKDCVIDIIKNKIGIHKVVKSLRPKECEIKKVSLEEADELFSQFHYIGPCKSKMCYGAYYEGKLIACTAFKRPVRQSKHPFELVRMTSHSDFRIHGIWSKLLKLFVNEYSPSSIVSFSDNRLFSGGVYEKIGFKFDGDVSPDYYWTKGKIRYHKSGLRKRGQEQELGLTEAELRTEQGYIKMWDVGKKRWVISF